MHRPPQGMVSCRRHVSIYRRTLHNHQAGKILGSPTLWHCFGYKCLVTFTLSRPKSSKHSARGLSWELMKLAWIPFSDLPSFPQPTSPWPLVCSGLLPAVRRGGGVLSLCQHKLQTYILPCLADQLGEWGWVVASFKSPLSPLTLADTKSITYH